MNQYLIHIRYWCPYKQYLTIAHIILTLTVELINELEHLIFNLAD